MRVIIYSLYLGVMLLQLLYALNTETARSFVAVTGASGYIGRSVVQELVSRNIPTIAIVRTLDLPERTRKYLFGSEIAIADVSDPRSLEGVYRKFSPSSTVCCLASRSGIKRDAWAIDYSASLNCFRAQELMFQSRSKSRKLNHFVLLSAFCVGKPRLQFQLAKLQLEAIIRNSTSASHSILRPTAFFKSVDGQFENVAKGLPTLYFGKGSVRANPISERDLAELLVNCAIDPISIKIFNQTKDVGGPDSPLSKYEQLQLIYDSLNISVHRRNSISIPAEILNLLINSCSACSIALEKLGFNKYGLAFEDAAEIARIVKYYAEEDMVTSSQDERYGKISLRDHFQSVALKGGQLEEIDRMTTATGVFELLAKNKYASKE